MRALKRRIADVVWRQLQVDLARPEKRAREDNQGRL